MLTGQIPFLSKGEFDRISRKYDGHVTFSVGSSDYGGSGCAVVSSTEGDELQVLYITRADGKVESYADKFTAEGLLDHMGKNNIVRYAWGAFLHDVTGDMKHAGPSFDGLVGTLKFDAGKEEA